jgi:hypothetical protein
LFPTGAMAIYISNVYSANGGTTWADLDGNSYPRTGLGGTSTWTNVGSHSLVDLTAGTGYRFGVRVGRESGSADVSDSRCQVLVQFQRR